jgi:hypothetical protein
MSNFIEKCVTGYATLEEIDDYIDEWHEGKGERPLYQYLGMKRSEYSLWVADPNILPFIVTAHHQGRDVADVLDEFSPLALAARADGPHKAKELIKWLKKEGLWE